MGTWKATAELEAHRIDLDPKQGGIRQWRDGGSDAAGKTEITVDIDAEGNATGTITGAAGPLQARGRFADGALRMRVEAVQHDTRAFNGVLLGELEKDRITGSLRISSGDSLRVRVAKVSLAK